MVKIEDFPVEQIQKKLKKKRIEQLVKEVFGKFISVDECVGDIFIAKKARLRHYISFNMPKSFLVISPVDNEFRLYNGEYFDKTRELAELYETNFGGEAIIKTNYFSKK